MNVISLQNLYLTHNQQLQPYYFFTFLNSYIFHFLNIECLENIKSTTRKYEIIIKCGSADSNFLCYFFNSIGKNG